MTSRALKQAVALRGSRVRVRDLRAPRPTPERLKYLIRNTMISCIRTAARSSEGPLRDGLLDESSVSHGD